MKRILNYYNIWLKKMGISAKILNEEDQEDAGLLKAMLEGRKDDFVHEEEVLKAMRE